MTEKPTFEKTRKFDPALSLYFAAFVVQAPVSEIEKIKQYILSLEKTRLIYQHKDAAYLVISRGDPKRSEF
jgi:hypothetical protein